MDATDVMNSLRVDTLKSIAKKAGISKTITRKPELIEALNLFVKTDPAGFIQRLGESERNLLAEAVHNKNRIEPVVFSAKYNVECPRPNPWGKGSLIHLVISGDRDSSEIEVPNSVAEILRPLLKKPALPKPATIEQLPESLDLKNDVRPIRVHSGAQTAFFELRRVLQLVQSGKVRIQAKSGRPTPVTERAISASLTAPDLDLELPGEGFSSYTLKGGPVRAHAWAVLVQQCGWCKATGETLRLTKAGQQMLQESSPESFRDGLARLRTDDKFDELQRISNIRGQSGNARRWMTKPSERRSEILDGLAKWPTNEWLEFDEAYRFLNACGHPFTVTEEPTSLYFVELRYGYIDDQDGIDRQYYRVFLMESLATLGLVDMGYVYPHYLWPELSGGWGTDDMDFCGRYDGLRYVRLNPLGLYALGMTDGYIAPAAEKRNLFTVLPNREIAAAGSHQLLPADVSMLELFARKKSDHVWSIDGQLILDYLESGGSLDDAARFLTENAAEVIPHTIGVWFDDLRKTAGAVVRTEEALLIEFQNPTVAVLVAHDSKAGKLCLLAGERMSWSRKRTNERFATRARSLAMFCPDDALST